MSVRYRIVAVVLGAALALPVTADEANSDDVAALRAEVAALKARLEQLERPAEPPELGGQMLELQIRHARLWFAGDAANWTLAAFQLAELREALAGIAETNAEHESLQPQRLDETLNALMLPAVKRVQAAIDTRKRSEFATAYDGLTAACNACHDAASFGFNRFQRPRTPLLDNQQYTAPKQ